MKKGFLIDMDGVIYRSSQLIPGAVRFIQLLQEHHIPFLFLTNNSQRTRRDVATKLQRMGMPVEEYHIFTCAMATARFLASQKPGGTAYVIGEGQNYVAPLHTDDLSQAFLRAVEKPAVGEALNVVDDAPLRMVELARQVLNGFKGGRIRHVPPWAVSILAGQPLGEMATSSARCRNERAKQRLGWQPRYPSLSSGLPSVIRAFQAGRS